MMRRLVSAGLLVGLCAAACQPGSSIAVPTAPAPIATGAATSVGAAPETGLKSGQIAPPFSTTLLDGSIQSLKGFKGKVVLLNFWATWCGPCRNEMPYLQGLADQYTDRGFVVLAINNRENAEKIQPFLDEYKLHFPVALDPAGRINGQYEVRQYPTSYVIDRDGVILARQFGAFPEGAVESALTGWLAAK